MSGLAAVPELAFAFILMLGVLITVHEFGHFLAAKLCGVRVLKFSIGFGPAIGIGRYRLQWERGGTEYVIAWFPLGGFVRMLGDATEEMVGDRTVDPTLVDPEHVDPALREQSFLSKSVWQKLFITFAGPAMNLALPVLILWGTLAVGIDRPAPVVGTVERGSPAAEAGLVSGDRILAVDGEPIVFWDEVEEAVRDRPGDELAFEIERAEADPARFDLQLRTRARDGLDLFRQTDRVGWLGLQHPRQRAVLGIPDGASPAGRAGLRSGDRAVAIDGEAVEDYGTLARLYAAGVESVALRIERGTDPEAEPETVEVRVPALGDLERLGVIPAVVLVAAVSPGSAAEDAGLLPGDLIVAVDSEPIGSFFTFQETVLTSRGRTLDIVVARAGETRHVPVAPRLTEANLGGGEEELYLIGIQGENAILRGAVARDRERNPLVAIPRATAMTVELTGLFLQGLQKLIVGDISRKNIGGPIEIARQSHQALQRGWDDFLRLLILISINLGILNLLPIPILDGGQAVVHTIEAVKRSPLSLRTRELVQQVGFVFLLMIMGMAFWNDISRHWSTFVDWLRGLT